MVDSAKLDNAQRLLAANQAVDGLKVLQEIPAERVLYSRRWHHLMGVAMVAQGRLQDGVEYGLKALSLGEHVSTRVNVGVAYIAMGAYEDALKIMSCIRDPDAESLLIMSEPLIRLGRVDEALRVLTRASAQDSSQAQHAGDRLRRLQLACQDQVHPRKWPCGHARGEGETTCWSCHFKRGKRK